MATSISGGGVMPTTSTSAALRRRQQRQHQQGQRQVNGQRLPSHVEAQALPPLPEGVTFLLNWCVRVELHARRRAAQAAQVSVVNSYGA